MMAITADKFFLAYIRIPLKQGLRLLSVNCFNFLCVVYSYSIKTRIKTHLSFAP